MAMSFRCYSIALLNIDMYLKYGDKSKIIYILLIVPVLFLYFTIFLQENYILLEIYFPLNSLGMLYSCFVTSNVYGALAGITNAWGSLVNNNLRKNMYANDLYNFIMMFYIWFSYECICSFDWTIFLKLIKLSTQKIKLFSSTKFFRTFLLNCQTFFVRLYLFIGLVFGGRRYYFVKCLATVRRAVAMLANKTCINEHEENNQRRK